jgi:DNA-binding NtrC family response regulator
MRTLESCVVAAADNNGIEELRDVSLTARHDQRIADHIASHPDFVDVSTEQLPNTVYDVVIVENQWVIASRILKSISQINRVNNALIVNSTKALHLILGQGLASPSVMTLDLLLDAHRDDPEEKKRASFSATGELYLKVKELWPLSFVMGISAWVFDADGSPFEQTASLINTMWKNGDDVYQKNEQLWPFLIYLVRNGLSIYQARLELRRVQKEEARQRELAEKNEELARIERAARVVSGAPSLAECPEQPPVPYLIGRSPEMRYVYWAIEQYARSNIPVHINGETGTGKKLVALAIHELSARKNHALKTIDCAAFHNDQTLHSELLGHKKNSFTDAKNDKRGLVQEADKGTILFDDIDDLIPAGQAMLLRLLEEKKGRWLGANEEYDVDVRIVSASKVNLQMAIEDGSFRNDLLYRLFADRAIRIPALRERPEDIADLFDFFLEGQCKALDKTKPLVSEEAYTVFRTFPWPGNVRQLKAMVESICALWDLSKPISSDTARSFLPEESLSASDARIDPLTKLTLSHPYVAKRLDDFEAGCVKSRSTSGKQPSLADIAKQCGFTQHVPVSQFFTKYREIIKEFSASSGKWPCLRKLKQWPS